MNRNRTKNQLIPTPILIPKMRASWKFLCGSTTSMVGRAELALGRQACARERAMMPSKSLPAGNVPYSNPPSPASREAQKASATAVGA